MSCLSLSVKLSSAISTVLVIVACLSPSINDDSEGYYLLFSWHPVFMSIGVVFLLSYGLVSYITSFGKTADRHFPNRSSRRVLHGAIQITACMFIVLGYLCALAQHAVDGTNNLGGGGVTQAYSVHTWMGYASLAFILGQAGTGLQKFVIRTRDDKNSVPLHGTLGPLVYVFAMATSIVGFNALLPDRVEWRIVVSISISITALLTVLFVFYGPTDSTSRVKSETYRISNPSVATSSATAPLLDNESKR